MRKLVCSIMVYSLVNSIFADDIYQPPNEIECILTRSGETCTGFNHHYLIENQIMDERILPDKIDKFYFKYGIAFDPDRKVTYSYQNTQGFEVVLTTTYADIQPDLSLSSGWVRQGARKHFFYTCQNESSLCVITHLPFLGI